MQFRVNNRPELVLVRGRHVQVIARNVVQHFDMVHLRQRALQVR